MDVSDHPQRGSRVHIRINKSSTANDIIREARKQMAMLNKAFSDEGEYSLCYSDGQPASALPNGSGMFTLSAYKALVLKDMQRWFFFLKLAEAGS